MRLLMIAAAVLISIPALAQTRGAPADGKWTAAPTPNIGAGDTILPAARASQPIEADGSTPFSGMPSGSVGANGATSANQVNGVSTPNLSK
jgi:hypothetical protein